MKILLSYSENLKFDDIVEFETDIKNLFECFFFLDHNLIASKFLKLEELKKI